MTDPIGRRPVVALVLGMALLVAVAARAYSDPLQAQTRPQARTPAQAASPLRAVLYLTAPKRTSARKGRPAPLWAGHGRAALARDLAGLAWAGADAALVPWSARGTAADTRFGNLLAAITATGAHVRGAALIERPLGTAAAQLRALAARARLRSYLHVGSRPAVFIAPALRSRRGCAEARRWRAAGRRMWIAQATFPGSAACRAAADAWFADSRKTHISRAPGAFLIRPGSWATGPGARRLERSPELWQRAVAEMTASRAPLQLVDSLNDWSRGTAIAPSAGWQSPSGFGSYLDALHAQPADVSAPGVVPTQPTSGAVPGATPPTVTPPPAVAGPTVDPAAIAGVTAHEATVSSTVSTGSAAATWWVEFGPTTAYGQSTAPAALPAGNSRSPVSTLLSSLSSATPYHARVVVASAVGKVASADTGFTTLADSQTVRAAAAGDIACDPTFPAFAGGSGTATECQQRAVSSAILAGGYNAVLALGDIQYNNGSQSQYAASYNPTWGRFKSITRPAIGNHDYGTPTLYYFSYFGSKAGAPSKGYYSWDLGAWHMVVLNSNCAQVSCAAGSPQENWLRADLAAHPTRCTLAYWHHPRFSSGQAGDAIEMTTLWSDLVAGGADVALTGHDHEYERFAPQSATGARDVANGTRQFVVGTGGVNLMSFRAAAQPNSEVRSNSTFGFLSLSLAPGSYSWRFVSVPSGGFSDSGSNSCH